jgi:DNA-binding transcriptional regulator YiaG
LISEGRLPFLTFGKVHDRDCHLTLHVAQFWTANEFRPETKRERFQQLTQNPKVKTGKVFAADLRKSKIHPTVKKLTAWRKLNRLSQRKAVAVLAKYYFHATFASLRSWEEGRRSPNSHTAAILEKISDLCNHGLSLTPSRQTSSTLESFTSGFYGTLSYPRHPTVFAICSGSRRQLESAACVARP